MDEGNQASKGSDSVGSENHSRETPGAGVGAGVQPERQDTEMQGAEHSARLGTRKPRKAGLCKRRGCLSPAVKDRLCALHAGVMAEVVGAAIGKGMAGATKCPTEGCTLLANRTGFCCTHQPAPGALPVSEAGAADTEPHSVDDLKVTHGKNGVPPLPALVSVGNKVSIVVCVQGDGVASWDVATVARVDAHGFYVAREGFELYRFAWVSEGDLWKRVEAMPEEHEQPNDKFESPRVCVGVPGAVGDELCHTVMGEDAGDRCARCQRITDEREAERLLRGLEMSCARVGCGRQPAEGSRYCGHHKRVSETVAAAVLADAFEASWQYLAEDARLDAYTVAVCKQLRDREVAS